MKVLVTGASGFIGKGLVRMLASDGSFEVHAACRRPVAVPGTVRCHAVGDIDERTDWGAALRATDAVVHLAARAHRGNHHGPEQDELEDRVNHRATARLASEAGRAGVRRFVFLSTIAVHGVASTGAGALTPDDPIRPRSAYAASKARAEDCMRAIGARSGMETVVIRPPMVYGPGAPGNFARLVSLVRSGVPLPFAGVANLRSMTSRDNLVDLVRTCLRHPSAVARTFLVSDGADISTPDLVRGIAAAMNRRVRMFRVRESILGAALKLAAGDRLRDQLLSSLRVDISQTGSVLGWRPPRPVADCLRESVREAFH